MTTIQDVKLAAMTAFRKHYDDGTIDTFASSEFVGINGGNWSIEVENDDGDLLVSCSVPHNDPNYMDDDPGVFVDNVFGAEVIDSLRAWNDATDGLIVDGLRSSMETWSEALADRIDSRKEGWVTNW